MICGHFKILMYYNKIMLKWNVILMNNYFQIGIVSILTVHDLVEIEDYALQVLLIHKV